MIEKIKSKLKDGKLIFIIGIAGIGLIFLSTLTPKTKTVNEREVLDTEAYCAELEEKVERVVGSIMGGAKAEVAVTLESGSRYVYADEGKSGESTAEKSTTIIKSSNGDEGGLLIAEYLPSVRGVAIVCNADETKAEQVRQAVKALLGISAKKIYVTQYANKE